MAQFNVPGLKKSAGQKSFTPCAPGNGYRGTVSKFELKVPNDNSPTDIYEFTIKVIEGPDQDENGTSPKDKLCWASFRIKKEDHPEYTEEQMAIDEMKSFLGAAGVEISKADKFNPESAVGQEVTWDITESVSKKNQKVYLNNRNWQQA